MLTKKWMLVIGQFSLSLGILLFLLSYLVWDNHRLPMFTAAILFGLALVFNSNVLAKNREK